MDLDSVFQAFINMQTVIVCLAVYLMTFVIRKVVEGFWKGAKANHYWREVWLPIGPIVNGGLIGLMAKTFVWPAVIGTSLSGRIMYGAICGVFSALLYARVRSFISNKPSKTDKVGVKKTEVQFPSIPPMTSDSPPAFTESSEEDNTPVVPPTGRG